MRRKKKNTAEKKLPKLKFHRPKTFELAVTRLQEIQTALTGDQDLPKPKVFDVVEIVHGDHSHYHLAGDDDHDHDHAETTDEKKHKVEVDVITEFVDISRWLGDVAADGDMEEEEWNSVKELSSEMTKTINTCLESADDEKAKRAALVKQKSKLDECISKLKSMTKPAANAK